jgi:solute carrier family 30 (zinc transporter), member 5/7
MLKPKVIDTSGGLLPVSCLGLLVNLIGVFYFQGQPDHHDSGASGDNLRGVYLHMLADSLGSLGVIFSTICVKYCGFVLADSLSSFVLACFILASAIPFLRQTIAHLVLETPKGLKKKVKEVEKELSVI